MANQNGVIYTAADYKISWTVNGTNYQLQVVESFDWGSKLESEYIHTIGTKEPVGLKTNTFTYPGKFQIENGELEKMLIEQSLIDATHAEESIISIVSFDGNYKRTFESVVIESNDNSIKAKDKRSLVSIDFKAISYNRN